MVLINHIRLGALAAGTLLFAGSATMAAGPLLTADFDVNDPTFSYGYAYAQAGPANGAGGEAPGAGVGGTAGLQVTADFTNATGFFSGFGGGVGQIPPRSPVTSPASPSEFTYSGDFAVSGLAQGTTTTLTIELALRGPDTDADADADRDLIYQGNVDRTVTADGMFQTLVGDFGSATAGGGTTFAGLQTFLANGGMIDQVQVNFNLPAGNDFGRDADNVFRADNLTISQVPEPASLALLGAGALLALGRRRRVR